MAKKILVIIGEASGDLHGGSVLTELKKLLPKLTLIGTGGKIFQKLAQKTYYKIEELEIIGWVEALKNWSYLKNILKQIVTLLDQEKPDALFLVDYVGFNLRLASEAKKRKIPVYFYIAPQVWAWKKGRITQIKATIKKLIVLFPFEVEFFAKENCQVACFGHPLLDIVKTTLSKKQTLQKYKLDKQKKLVCLFAGSRKQELLAHLPKLLQSVELLSKHQDLQFACIASSQHNLKITKELCAHKLISKKILFVCDSSYNLAGAADLALACSGTATLELAILQTPMVIFYHTSYFNFLLARYIFKIKRFGLPNIIYDKEFIPELLQRDFTPQKLAKMALTILRNHKNYQKMQQNFSLLKKKLGKPHAYKKTAEFLAKEFD